MNIFVNCNNLDVFKEFVKTYSEENKKHHFIFGRQDVNYDLQNTDRELVQILIENGIVDYELLHASTVDYVVPDEWKCDRFFNNELLYESVKKSKEWHHNYLDEHFHSCSPVLFNKFKF